MLRSSGATPERLTAAKADGYNAVVLRLEGNSDDDAIGELAAARRIQQSGLELHYWIEIGRCPELADAHPLWMASLQGHPEWRRFFPDVPEPKPGEVVKNYPWVPILYRETFDAHLSRVRRLLAEKPAAAGVLLNDLQGAPSACGCGHPLCRWTADYGPIRTATPLGNDAPARFVAECRKIAPQSQVIPVWTTECEEHDKDGLCAGVGCFEGTCWRAYTQQLMPLADESERIAVLAPYKAFQRDLARYGGEAAWVRRALESFQTMPPIRSGRAIPAQRLIAVVQGWNVSPDQLRVQIEHARSAGAAGYVVSADEIAQSWQPRVVSTAP
jgi:hypothetical protein